MSAFTWIDDDAPLPKQPASVVAIGNFDGVHRGHLAVIDETRREADEAKLACIVLTFDPHPMDVLGTTSPPVLTTLARRADLLERAGIDRVFVRRFTPEFASWAPDRFARELLAGALAAKRVVVGENFRFGAGRAGDLAMLTELGRELGFEARAHGMASDEQGPFSSTRARNAIATGDLDEAMRVLSRPHSLSGVVAHGAKRGRTIGFPTANLEDVAELLPPDGVYAVVVDELDDHERGKPLANGVMNVGVRPTVAGGLARTVEVHLFDLSRDLYGARLRVHVVARLRDERRFAGLDALKAQIAQDAAAAREACAAFLDAQGAQAAHGSQGKKSKSWR